MISQLQSGLDKGQVIVKIGALSDFRAGVGMEQVIQMLSLSVAQVEVLSLD